MKNKKIIIVIIIIALLIISIGIILLVQNDSVQDIHENQSNNPVTSEKIGTSENVILSTNEDAINILKEMDCNEEYIYIVKEENDDNWIIEKRSIITEELIGEYYVDKTNGIINEISNSSVSKSQDTENNIINNEYNNENENTIDNVENNNSENSNIDNNTIKGRYEAYGD